MDFMQNKIIIITGGTSGIGKALVQVYAAAGAKIVLAARHQDNLKKVAAQLKLKEDSFLTIVADVSIEEDCQQLIYRSVERFGKIDVLINNAGISMRALFAEVDLNVLKQVMNTNFWGTVYCTKYALPHLLKTKGTVVGISSIAGKKGLPTRSGYSASKFAMEGFLQSLRTEHLKDGLHVLVACPGFTTSNIRNTALVKDGSAEGESPRDEMKMMSAEEVALRIFNAIQEQKRDLTLTTQGKLLVFLNKWLPSLTDRLTYNHFVKEKGNPLTTLT